MRFWLGLLALFTASAWAIEGDNYDALGIRVGETDCKVALDKIYERSLEICKRQTNYMVTTGEWAAGFDAPPGTLDAEVSRSGPQLCRDHVNHRHQLSLERMKKFNSASLPCSRVGYRISDYIRDAYQLELNAPVQFPSNEKCPLVFTYEEEILDPEAAPATFPLACQNGKLALVAKRTSASFDVILKRFTTRFGKAERVVNRNETVTLLPSNTEQPVVRETTFFTSLPRHAMVIRYVNKSGGRPAKIFNETYAVYYTDEYLKTHLKNYELMKARLPKEKQSAKRSFNFK